MFLDHGYWNGLLPWFPEPLKVSLQTPSKMKQNFRKINRKYLESDFGRLAVFSVYEGYWRRDQFTFTTWKFQISWVALEFERKNIILHAREIVLCYYKSKLINSLWTVWKKITRAKWKTYYHLWNVSDSQRLEYHNKNQY